MERVVYTALSFCLEMKATLGPTKRAKIKGVPKSSSILFAWELNMERVVYTALSFCLEMKATSGPTKRVKWKELKGFWLVLQANGLAKLGS